jgi:DNA-3-methyladenine glycosylase II
MMVFPNRDLLPVRAPFRLDLTADALRRLATNTVDVVTPDGAYYRALDVGGEIVAVRVTQIDEATLCVESTGASSEGTLALVARTLGTGVDLRPWARNAARVPWIAPLERAFRGVKPPRYASLWEACVHAIVFQQISIHAAASIMRRLITAIGTPVCVDGVALMPFPSSAALLAADDATLRAAGLSKNKVTHLRAVADALTRGDVRDEEIEALSTLEASERLTQLRGIGPWSAAVVLLRGFGRLDIFPLRDSGVARSAALLSGDSELNLDSVLEKLGPVRGMLYYHLLLGRLRNHPAP